MIYMMATRSLSTVMMKMAMIGDGDLKVDSPVLDYDHQVETLTEAGFALWDVVTKNLGIFWLKEDTTQVARCTIRNSDDSSIRDKQPNDIKGTS